MRRVLVIGPGGAGKSTLSQRLGAALRIRVVHLDSVYWRAGWVEPPKTVWKERVQELVTEESWVMDGNYSGTLDVRLAACDTVVFLDMPRLLCLARLLKRRLRYRKISRPDMATGCEERLTLQFISWVWNYQNRSRPKIMEMLNRVATSKNVVQLKSNKEVEQFLAKVQNATAIPAN